ncbi:acetate kinase [Cylindrobasidium torrendii FP15055 ss-10]|uniref:Probable acetate kinase n=1 Tax=Cylindrobasidium torrendii FP15055 ss-10 TaxID=1314674 RepID=A0A0D7BPQ1_9AGAR|nr:acetate kinase [Cylindrobasidium torrendii FP15055 ss-10]
MARTGYILACNSGSSSLKISLYRLADSGPSLRPVLASSISNITSPPAQFIFSSEDDAVSKYSKDEEVENISDHASAFTHFLSVLENDTTVSRHDLVQICHRVVHGGAYSHPVIINDKTLHYIERLSDLAPLHNGPALAIIQTCLDTIYNANSIAFFDTMFHHTLPSHVRTYPIDQKVALERGLRKYGFHGLSYASILRSVAEFLDRPESNLNLIVLHLGSGASICAIKQGKSYDTSMGLTPLNGLPGATRSGAVDPSLIFHYTNKAGKISHDPKFASDLRVTEAETVLNSQSGWKALTGTQDFGLVSKRAKEGSKADKLAFDLLVDRILGYIGSYYVKLSGKVDAVVFSGGIGEKAVDLRRVVADNLECLSFAPVDESANANASSTADQVSEIGMKSGDGSRRLLVCKTDEQYEMAYQCIRTEEFWKEI